MDNSSPFGERPLKRMSKNLNENVHKKKFDERK